MVAVFGSEAIELGGAGPLAVVAAAFVSCYFWQKDGWEVDDVSIAGLTIVTTFLSGNGRGEVRPLKRKHSNRERSTTAWLVVHLIFRSHNAYEPNDLTEWKKVRRMARL